MTLRNGDPGFDSIYKHWLKENFPVKFNYQGYMWYKVEDDSGFYFQRGHALEIFGGYGHEDRPYRPDADVIRAE